MHTLGMTAQYNIRLLKNPRSEGHFVQYYLKNNNAGPHLTDNKTNYFDLRKTTFMFKNF
jgi:hypothetical protein